MIPKKIHYCWFWKWKKNELIQKCISSWKKNLPDYEIIEWNEDNFDISQNEFIKKAYKEKKWAFVADFARLKILYDNWWIYLDTDMEVLKSLDVFLKNKVFLWFEDEKFVNWAIIWTEKENKFINDCLKNYINLENYINIPVIITKELEKIWLKKYWNQNINDIYLYETSFFYPIWFNEKSNHKKITDNTYTIHHRDTSWYSFHYKLLKKLWLLPIISFLGKIKNKILKK